MFRNSAGATSKTINNDVERMMKIVMNVWVMVTKPLPIILLVTSCKYVNIVLFDFRDLIIKLLLHASSAHDKRITVCRKGMGFSSFLIGTSCSLTTQSLNN